MGAAAVSIDGGSVHHNVNASGTSGAVSVTGATVGNNVVITSGAGAVVVSNNTVTNNVSVTDNAPASPQQLRLKGTGTYVQLTPTSLNIGNQPVGTKSLAKTITLSNKGAVAVTMTGISVTGTNASDFAQTHTCGTTVTSGASCFIKVTFTPSATGTRTAQLAISDNGGGSPQKASLSGTGTP